MHEVGQHQDELFCCVHLACLAWAVQFGSVTPVAIDRSAVAAVTANEPEPGGNGAEMASNEP
jgi:hypothetical protein